MVVTAATRLRQPHRGARYLEVLSGTYHRCYESCRILSRDAGTLGEVGKTRPRLAEATGIVLVNGLGLVGASAPERVLLTEGRL